MACCCSPLPYPEPDRIVRVLERLPNGGPNSISTLNYLDWTNQNTVFESMAAESGWRAMFTGGKEPVVIRGRAGLGALFRYLRSAGGNGPYLSSGRGPARQRSRCAAEPWALGKPLRCRPRILGRDIVLNDEAYTVVGILPKGGPFDRTAAQIWKPLAFQSSNMTRDFRWLGASARLRPGVTLEQARTEMGVIGQRLASAYPGSNKGWGVAVDRLSDVLIGPDLRVAVTILFAADGIRLADRLRKPRESLACPQPSR